MTEAQFLDLNYRFWITGALLLIAVSLMYIAFGKDSHKTHKHKK